MPSDSASFVKKIVQSRQRVFGLNKYLASANFKHDTNSSDDASPSEFISTMTSELTRCFSSFPFFNFKSVFKNDAKINLEIGAGAGEWAIAQATHDPQSNWITMELRHDRVYETFLKAIYARLENVCILGGDALTLLPRHFAAECIDRAFVNYPEPPQQTGGQKFESQGKHLLNQVMIIRNFNWL